MAADTTTHLICAPDFDGVATVRALQYPVGAQIAGDARLLTLVFDNGSDQHVHAPEAGVLNGYVVAVGDPVRAGELLALMDIEETPTGWLFPPAATPATADAEQATDPVDWLMVSVDAARLAARLGVDLSELSVPGRIDVADVEHFVREKLARSR
ncbi:hypothetical protein [Jeongeupia naejangsanensis]|uniref:Lipoyl-binding domain-containing protein n=1 Tax=Jeongeupia naejangsanensis TaxID=613195 RepID=A0ABS2BLT9_9NEIS|nr:hypothetical protein [Jeongeupia naejangsanensis]MBM3116577.1 hypothetical protein [Jeongeupia naejangsanensis]